MIMNRASALEWPVMARPEVVVAGKFPLSDRDFSISYGGSPTYALHLYEYQGIIRMDSRSLALRPGDLTISPMGMVTRYHLPQPGRHWCIHFTLPKDASRRPAQQVRIPLHLHLPTPMQQRVAETVLHLAGLSATRTHDEQRRGTVQAAMSAQLQGLLLELALLAEDRPRKRPQHRTAAALARAEAAIESQVGQTLDIDAVARSAGITRAWLAQVFRARHGQTLHRWHLHRRIDHARILLRTTTLSVGAIAERLGFTDAQHLNKQFRRMAGCAPTAYRAHGSWGDG
jgi:AraC-like DNA-binding protein